METNGSSEQRVETAIVELNCVEETCLPNRDASEAPTMKQYALCLSNDFGADFSREHVLPGRAYEVLSKEQGALRVVDDTGDDFPYPAKNFCVLSEADSAVLRRSLWERDTLNAVRESRENIVAGRFVIESPAAHVARILKRDTR